MPYDIRKLTHSEDIDSVLFMTYPSYKKDVLQNMANYIIFAAYMKNKPAGLLIYKNLKENVLELVSVFVEQEHRNNHIARDLIEVSLVDVQKENIKKIQVTYMSKKPYTEALEKIMDRLGFKDEIARQSVVKISIESLAKAKFLKRLIGLPEGFVFKLWKETTQSEKDKLLQESKADNWIPEQLNPFSHLNNYIQEHSKALFHKDEIIGWMIMHMIANDTIRFTCSYAKEEFQYLTFQLRIFNAIQEQLLSEGIKYISWTTPFVYKPMVNFNQKWMSKYSVYEGVSKERSLLL